MNPRHLCWLAAGLAFACQEVDHDQERCADVSAQIEQALVEYTQNRVLLPGAEPCELTPESFDPRTSRESKEYLLEAFATACQTQAETCWGAPVVDRPPPQFGPPQPAPPPSEPPPYAQPDRPALAP
jgi:hypothetical protein